MELLALTFREVSDGSLGNAVLEEGIYPTEGKLLPCIVARLLEGVVMESSIVTVVVQDFDSVFYRILLKGKLCGKCFIGLVVELEMDKLEAAEVVDKDSGTFVALLAHFAFQLCVKYHFPQCHLVNQDALYRFGCHKDLVVGLGFLALLRKLGHCPKEAACSLGRQHLGNK